MPFSSIPFDAHKLGIALFMAEFVTYATRSEQQNHDLFLFVENSVMWLDTCVSSFANFHIVFMLHMTRFVGFFPIPTNDMIVPTSTCVADASYRMLRHTATF